MAQDTEPTDQEGGICAPPTRDYNRIRATKYNHTYPMAEARTLLRATHVGGEQLTPSHGCPLRAVVPHHRGWFWVKWLTRIEVLGGILSAAREILRQL